MIVFLVSLWARPPSFLFPCRQQKNKQPPHNPPPKARPRPRRQDKAETKEVHTNQKEQCNSLKSTVCLFCPSFYSFFFLLLFLKHFTHNPSFFFHTCKQCSTARKVSVSWCKQSGEEGGKVGNKVAVRMPVSWREEEEEEERMGRKAKVRGWGERRGRIEGRDINTSRKGRRRRLAGATVIEIHRQSRWYLCLSRVLCGEAKRERQQG